MDTIEIDGTKALSLLREVIAGNEDFCYETKKKTVTEDGYGEYDTYLCLYAHEGKPDCVVGRALHKAGVTVEQLEAMDNIGATYDGFPTGIGVVAMPENVNLTEQGREVFKAAQEWQDAGFKWGEALSFAEKALDKQSLSL